MAGSGRGQWWTTLPGVLTATAALITALTGLVLGLGQLGLLGGDDEPQARPAVSSAAPVSGGSSGAASAAPSAAPVTGAATTTLPLEQPFRLGDASYELLEAQVRPDADGQVALVLAVRMTKHTGGDARFWDDSSASRSGPTSTRPAATSTRYVAGRSSLRGEVLVLLPDDIREAELVLRYYDNSRSVPFTIVPAGG